MSVWKFTDAATKASLALDSIAKSYERYVTAYEKQVYFTTREPEQKKMNVWPDKT